MANSLGTTMDKNEQIARWTKKIAEIQEKIDKLKREKNPSEEAHKKIAHLERIIREYEMLIKDNQEFLANRDRRMQAIYDKYVNRK